VDIVDTRALSPEFEVISKITRSHPSSWERKVFLTFDIDWAHDAVITDTIELLELVDASATWFLTHDTPVKERIRQNPKFELGIHPNFNFLLNGDERNGRDSAEVIARLMELVPDARSVRSHSLTQSSGLIERFKEVGLTHESNQLVPHFSGIALAPYSLWNGMCSVPFLWEDDVHLAHGLPGHMDDVLRHAGLRVLNFHPVHVFLNTESLARYENTRPLHQNPKELIKYRYEGYGTRSRLLQLLQLR
jgi:hypothetical protein